MHERSLVKNLLHQVQQIAAAEGNGAVEEICVQAGTLSGIEPFLFQTAFEDMASPILGAPCRLILEVVPLTALCNDCDHQFEVIDFKFRCPVCQADSVHVVEGDEVKLMSITVNSEEPLDGVTS
ncbi:MAG: hydrogenase maturation nickel metallochaperone HypA [Planctomycetaceae bacterium]|nr:hydrogenase maturation nickel metallochaperone HypA [Planctomycetaceae bacterium]